MYTTVMTINIKPGMWEETWQTWQNIIHSNTLDMTGFLDMEILINHEDQKILEIAHWTDRISAESSINSNMGTMMNAFSHVMQSPPTLEGFDTRTEIKPREMAAMM
ncbi:MAG: hypothetical protein ACLFQV_07020 [Vulcanimicrobiota bacterium]